MIIHTLPDTLAAARAAALRMAALAVEAVQARGRFTVALSGGHSPWRMLEALAALDVPWSGVHVFQVDERVAPAGDPDRNATHIAESLLSRAPIAREQIHLMPVEAPDLAAAAGRYAETLAGIAGTPPVLDPDGRFESRQVWARDRRRPGVELVFLRRGDADELKREEFEGSNAKAT